MAVALDVGAKQCLIDFFEDDDGMHWHHRVLLIPSGRGDGRWVGASPDHELGIVDLSEHRVIPLTRKGPIPPDKAGQSYVFDPMSQVEYLELMRRARELSAMVGFVAPPAAAGTSGSGFWQTLGTSTSEKRSPWRRCLTTPSARFARPRGW